MRHLPWKFIGLLLMAACVLGVAWPYALAVGTSGWMAVSGRHTGCDARGAVLSLKTNLGEEELAKQIWGAMRLLKHDPSGLELWSTPHGQIWTPAGGGEAVSLDLAEQQRGIYSQFGHGARTGDVVLDVGANVGVYAREALRAGASKVIAIEPVPPVAECLRRNMRDEIAAGKVVVVEKGAWDKDDFLEMNIYPGNMAASSFTADRKGEQRYRVRLPLTTLDQIAASLALERVDFIKMDIEGSERRAVRGAATLIRRFKPRMALCVYHLADDPVAVPAAVRAVRTDYHQTCGACLYASSQISPQVYFFE